ncbi:unnamed protein product [Sphenostylis stenocarpa]|uniref:Uncharacterized protein n=1 Tax=Sphenostylis stenocarpa TaxID=92480 RepID=A0AA86T901_9FABA|nr:unnamed protein product [Sphenostylis stenocarpa]
MPENNLVSCNDDPPYPPPTFSPNFFYAHPKPSQTARSKTLSLSAPNQPGMLFQTPLLRRTDQLCLVILRLLHVPQKRLAVTLMHSHVALKFNSNLALGQGGTWDSDDESRRNRVTSSN